MDEAVNAHPVGMHDACKLPNLIATFSHRREEAVFDGPITVVRLSGVVELSWALGRELEAGFRQVPNGADHSDILRGDSKFANCSATNTLQRPRLVQVAPTCA